MADKGFEILDDLAKYAVSLNIPPAVFKREQPVFNAGDTTQLDYCQPQSSCGKGN